MGRPSKPVDMILLEGNIDHRTKKQLSTRKEAEAALLTGKAMKIWPEVSSNAIARKEFNRVRGLLKSIGKDDALHEAIVNRYAQIRAECVEFEKKREQFSKNLGELEQSDLDADKKFRLECDMQRNIVTLDRQIQVKRKMLLDIEKENIMTIASALRSVPKKVIENKEESPMAKFLRERRHNNP